MQNNTYNVYADNIHSGKFQNEQTAFKFADCFSKFHGVKRVAVVHDGKIIKRIDKGGTEHGNYYKRI